MQPVSANVKNRIVTVDALRGFALLGIMIVHFLYWYTAGPLPEQAYSKYNDAGSAAARIFSEVFLSGKFFAFFSALFGLSFYLQTANGSNGAAWRFAWRLALLLVIGLIHHAFWQGDILSIYAPLGFLLLLSGKMNNKWVLLTGIFLVLNMPGKIVQLVQLFQSPSNGGGFGDYAAFSAAHQKLITSGSWLQIFQHNLQHLSTKFDFQINSGRLAITLGFFMLGMYVGRQKWFEQGEAVRGIWRSICKKSASIAGVCLAVALVLFASNEIWKLGLEQNRTVGFFFSFLFDGFNACLVAFYVSGLTLLMFRHRWQRFFFSLAPVGKMALTSYLTQTIFGLLLFWGVGAGLYTKTSPGLNFLIAVVFFWGQVVFSRLWLKAFYYGPVEWLWRSATLLKTQPFVREKKQPFIKKEPLLTTLHETERIEKTGV